jgi:hypothetical protein
MIIQTQATPIVKANGKNGYIPNPIEGKPYTGAVVILLEMPNADLCVECA